MTLKKILVVFGTRPEAIKMAPVISALKDYPEFETRVCVTAQHRDMLDQVLSLFEIAPNYDLDLMTSGQTLVDISARVLHGITDVLAQWTPDLVLVHGDTSTTAMTATACFYQRIPIGHVEAGLRTGNMWSPWPEEFNRRLTGIISNLHFAPTETSAKNLLEEGVPPSTILVAGNTVIDALLHVTERLRVDKELVGPLLEQFAFLRKDRKLILVTGHRRENFGEGMSEICDALIALSKREDVQIVYAVHLNPNIKGPVESSLANHPNIHLIPPQNYLSFVYLMMNSYIILTDSGGIQEEAPSLGKPVLVMRDTTERPEAIEAGTALLVGAKALNIEQAANNLLDNSEAYLRMSCRNNPYGDGRSAERIVKSITKYFSF